MDENFLYVFLKILCIGVTMYCKVRKNTDLFIKVEV